MNRGGGGIGNGNTFVMENSWRMCVLVYLCTSRGCSDRAEHLEIAPEIIVVCIVTHYLSIKYNYFVVLTHQKFSYLLLLLQLCLSLCTFCGHEQATKRTFKIGNY